MKVTVYGKPGCVQCTATERALNSRGIPFDKVDLEESPGSISYLQARGYRSLPVVEVDGSLEWSGFQPGKIEQLAP